MGVGQGKQKLGPLRVPEGGPLCAEVVRLYGDRPDAPIQVLVAGALLQLGIALSALGRPEEALLAYDDLLRRFGDVTSNPDLAEVVATGRQLRGSSTA